MSPRQVEDVAASEGVWVKDMVVKAHNKQIDRAKSSIGLNIVMPPQVGGYMAGPIACA